MYYCQDCGNEFKEVELQLETHRLATPPFEKIYACPYCGGGHYYERVETHCRCCGAKLGGTRVEYCSEHCRELGRKMWEKELKRRRLRLADPLAAITREIENYNLKNNTRYSYGQYVALIRPALKRKGGRKR